MLRSGPLSCRGLATAFALLCALVGCGEAERESRDLPREWYRASPGEQGGRFLPERRAALERLQAEVYAAGEPVAYPHYGDAETIVLAIKKDFIATGTRRRLALLLEHEVEDPKLRIVALVDRPAAEILASLDLGPSAARLELVEAGTGPSPVTFQFLRDYAPLVSVVPGPQPRVAGLALFHGPSINKVVDAVLGVRIERSREMTERRFALTRRLAEVYGARLGADLPVEEIALRLDGGNVLSDGLGTCFATRVLLAQNREDRPFVERELQRVGCRRSVFLSAPKRLDFVQHVDTLLYVAGPRDVVLSMPVLYESDRIAEFQNVRALLEAGYTVHRVPRRTASVSYTNVLTTRRHVYVPQYTRYEVESERQRRINARIDALDPERQAELRAWYLQRSVDTERVEGDPLLEADNRRALDVFARLLPGKRIVPVNSDETLSTRGSWHCLSHELPPAR